MASATPYQVTKKLIDAARKWAVSRGRLRKMMDSRSASETQIEKAKKKHIEDATKLEVAVIEFERLYTQMRKKGPKKNSKPFPWRKVLGVVAQGANVLDRAINEPVTVRAQVIDTQGEPVDRP